MVSTSCQGLFEAQKPSGECRGQALVLTELPSSRGARQQAHKLVQYSNEVTLSSKEHNEEDKTGPQDGAPDTTFKKILLLK